MPDFNLKAWVINRFSQLPPGADGQDGQDGAPGTAATVNVGTVTTLDAEAPATVTNAGTENAALLNFGIPKGAKGDTGAKGATGADGADGRGVPVGGTAGQLLSKIDGTDYNTQWTTLSIPDELSDLSDDSTHRLVTDAEKSTWNSKQDSLVSGTNIKTINNASILGAGNITTPDTTYTASDFDIKDLTDSAGLRSAWSGKQDALGFSAVPDTRTVNSKPLSSDITLSASDVGAAASSHPHTANDVTDFDTGVSGNADVAANTGARHTHTNQTALDLVSGTNTGDQDLSGLVPNARTVNGHTLSSDVTVTASDVGLGNVTNESKATMFTNAALTGTPTAPTATAGTNTTQIATTSFVQSAVSSSSGGSTISISATEPATFAPGDMWVQIIS